MSTIEIHGTVAEGFEEVREEFRAVVAAEDGQSGAQLAAYLRGRKVVDLWAGPEVTDTTLTGLHSSSKGAAGLVVALLIQDGALDIDRPVAHYWPRSPPPQGRHHRPRCAGAPVGSDRRRRWFHRRRARG